MMNRHIPGPNYKCMACGQNVSHYMVNDPCPGDHAGSTQPATSRPFGDVPIQDKRKNDMSDLLRDDDPEHIIFHHAENRGMGVMNRVIQFRNHSMSGVLIVLHDQGGNLLDFTLTPEQASKLKAAL